MTVNVRGLAVTGAKVRLQELEVERRAILAAFPELRGGAGAPAKRADAAVPKVRRRRRRLSAAQRHAIGERMKKYWAERRKKR